VIKNILTIICLFLIGVCGGIFADQILWPYFIEKPLFSEFRLEKNPVYVTERKEVIIKENDALVDAIEKTEKTIVAIKAQTASAVIEGSGLVITSDGLMVTLAELVPQKATLTFYLDDKPVSFQVLKRDSLKNLALVKLEASNLSTLSFANLDDTQLGERVFILGTVFKKKQVNSIKVANEGVIRSFYDDFIQTNIMEKANLKGSALFNIKTEVLGINTIDVEGRVSAISVATIREFTGL